MATPFEKFKLFPGLILSKNQAGVAIAFFNLQLWMGHRLGLKGFFEDPSNYKDDVKNQIIEAVYKLRESGRTDILDATNEFVAKHKRPVPAKRTS